MIKKNYQPLLLIYRTLSLSHVYSNQLTENCTWRWKILLAHYCVKGLSACLYVNNLLSTFFFFSMNFTWEQCILDVH